MKTSTLKKVLSAFVMFVLLVTAVPVLADRGYYGRGGGDRSYRYHDGRPGYRNDYRGDRYYRHGYPYRGGPYYGRYYGPRHRYYYRPYYYPYYRPYGYYAPYPFFAPGFNLYFDF
jgi:hypothetical protein